MDLDLDQLEPVRVPTIPYRPVGVVDIWYMCKHCLRFFRTAPQLIAHKRNDHPGIAKERHCRNDLKRQCIRDGKKMTVLLKKLDD